MMRAVAAIPLCALLALAGCRDDREIRLMEQQARIVQLQVENQRLGQELTATRSERDALKAELAAARGVPTGELKLVPLASRLQINRYSGLRPGQPQLSDSPTTQPDGDALPDVFARVYVQVLDQDGFAIRAAGRLSLSLFDLSGSSPHSMGAYDFPPDRLAGHYRSSLGTEFYAFDLPLPAAPPQEGVTLRIRFDDLLTGRTLDAQGLLKLPTQ
ncbi:MAG: hypothetical protein BIFFINMI_00381 [Phycisphaerae bacterium]|nr:hypothetical protein [Phycisphaerae bacterium]